MKKIDILTMHRVINYGSFLQAYSLKKILENLDCEVGFIDINPGKQLSNSSNKNYINKKNLKWFFSKLDNQFLKRIFHLFFSYYFRRKFTSLWQPSIGIGNDYKYETNADAVIIGSDEVFNFSQKSNWGFSPQLFGEIKNTSNIFSYAASFGYSKFIDAEKLGIIEDLKNYLKNLKFISVRDTNSFEIIKNILGYEPLVHVDPTMVYDFSDDIPEIKIPYDYLLLYSYAGRTNSWQEIRVIKAFAKSAGLKVISVGTYHNWCDKNIIADPFELLSYFKIAKYVITDTFHGTIFSIINHKRFCTIMRSSNSEKLSSLLKKFNLQDREIIDINDLDKIISCEIDYTLVSEIIFSERRRSLQYLENCIRTINKE